MSKHVEKGLRNLMLRCDHGQKRVVNAAERLLVIASDLIVHVLELVERVAAERSRHLIYQRLLFVVTQHNRTDWQIIVNSGAQLHRRGRLLIFCLVIIGATSGTVVVVVVIVNIIVDIVTVKAECVHRCAIEIILLLLMLLLLLLLLWLLIETG